MLTGTVEREDTEMAEQTLKDFTSGLGHDGRKAADEIGNNARDLKAKAADIADKSTSAIKEQASNLADQASKVGAEAADRIKQTVEGQRGAGADFVGNLAETIRRAAGEFDGEIPMAANYIRLAATQVERVSDALREGELSDLVRGAQDFARRQPTAFLGLSLLAGFGVVRFLKSSGGAPRTSAATGGAGGYRDDRAG
jgi:gas vesicle protein